MSRTRAVVLALLTLALALGAAEMWRTDPSSRTFALAAGLFFGAVCLASAVQLAPARAPPVDPDGSTSIPSSPVRAFLYAVGMGAGAAAAYLLAFDTSTPSHPALTALLVCVSAGCGAIALYYLFRAMTGDPVYRLDASGISSSSLRHWSLPWREIENISTFEIQYVARIALRPTPAARERLNWVERLYGLGVLGVVIGPGATGLPLSDLERLVRDYWERSRV